MSKSIEDRIWETCKESNYVDLVESLKLEEDEKSRLISNLYFRYGCRKEEDSRKVADKLWQRYDDFQNPNIEEWSIVTQPEVITELGRWDVDQAYCINLVRKRLIELDEVYNQSRYPP